MDQVGHAPSKYAKLYEKISKIKMLGGLHSVVGVVVERECLP